MGASDAVSPSRLYMKEHRKGRSNVEMNLNRFHFIASWSQSPPEARESSGKSNMHQFAVTILFRLHHPPFSRCGIGRFRCRKPPCFCGKSYYIDRISSMNPLFSSTRKRGAKRDAKWRPSRWCVFDSLFAIGNTIYRSSEALWA